MPMRIRPSIAILVPSLFLLRIITNPAVGQECLSWQLRADGPISPRERHAMAYDERRGVVVLFGGAGYSGMYEETWEWDGSSWAPCGPSIRPQARQVHRMVYDRGRAVTILYGGWLSPYVYSNKVWEWDGAAWTLSQDTGAPRRFGHSMTYDSRRGAITVLGGDPIYAETWEFFTCLGDFEDDGVTDVDDECPNTVLGDTVMVGDRDTGVADQVLDNGCTMTELIASCKIDRRNHGETVRCVLNLVQSWRRDGKITPRDQGQILRCTVRPTRPRTGAR